MRSKPVSCRLLLYLSIGGVDRCAEANRFQIENFPVMNRKALDGYAALGLDSPGPGSTCVEWGGPTARHRQFGLDGNGLSFRVRDGEMEGDSAVGPMEHSSNGHSTIIMDPKINLERKLRLIADAHS